MVTDVKFLGAWNLFSAAEGVGLRFFAGLSSVAAIQGNPGQANYAAANRMMSALLGSLRRKNGAIRFKALMLPPIEDAGMAEDPEIRELLQRKGVAYIHTRELTGLFCRELFVAPADDDWVMFMKRLPSVETARIDDRTQPESDGALTGGGRHLPGRGLPHDRRDRLSGPAPGSTGRHQNVYTGARPLDRGSPPFQVSQASTGFRRHVSGDLHGGRANAASPPAGAGDSPGAIHEHDSMSSRGSTAFQDLLPPGWRRSSGSVVRGHRGRTVNLPRGKIDGRIDPALRGPGDPRWRARAISGRGFQDFPVRPDELRTRPMDRQMVLKWYRDRSGLDGRYRVIESLDGAGPGVVRGQTICRTTSDFAHLRNTRYQYPPYLLEALLQLVIFHLAAIDPAERRSMIPTEIGELRFARQCREGERITLEARMRGAG